MPPVNQPTSDIGYLLNKATRRFRLGLADALTPSGLRPQQAAVILAIARSADGSLTPRAIAESIDTDAATVSGLMGRLMRDDWLVSEPNPDDGRSRLMGLSQHAEDALPQILSAAEAVSAEATSCLTEDEVSTLSELLSRLCGGAETVTTKRKAGNK